VVLAGLVRGEKLGAAEDMSDIKLDLSLGNHFTVTMDRDVTITQHMSDIREAADHQRLERYHTAKANFLKCLRDDYALDHVSKPDLSHIANHHANAMNALLDRLERLEGAARTAVVECASEYCSECDGLREALK
jgi:hypothetical protein